MLEITPELVILAYRLFLDREPESDEAIDDKVKKYSTIADLRNEFIGSDEFRLKHSDVSSLRMSGFEPRMSIEETISEPDQLALFMRIQKTWQHLGEKEPYFSVLWGEQYLPTNIENNKAAFYKSGQIEVERLFKTLDRNIIDPTLFKSCLEYGCGVGRVTQHLANKFETVLACDISLTHLEIARSHLESEGVRNVSLTHISRVEDIFSLPKVDLIYSVLVLQHNPPPLIGLIIKQFVASLNPGGVAFFQVPTYQMGYRFALNPYLDETEKQEYEMHLFPQYRIFNIVNKGGGRVLEVMEDNYTGIVNEVSNTFLVQKN